MNSEEEEISRDRDVVDGDGGLGARLLQNPVPATICLQTTISPAKHLKGFAEFRIEFLLIRPALLSLSLFLCGLKHLEPC